MYNVKNTGERLSYADVRSRILCFVDRASLYNLVSRTNLVHNFFNMFIAFLYMFRATTCPSSGGNTVPMRRLGIFHSV